MNSLFTSREVLPMLFQAETSECGLTCLAMIANYHGNGIGLKDLREAYKLSGVGASIKDLMAAATELKLRCRPLKAECSDLENLELPMILHWDLDHFVVLKKVTKKKVLIHDPAVGVREYALSEVGLHFTGVALEVRKGKDFVAQKKRNSLTLSQFFEPGKGFFRAIIQVFAMSVLIQVLAILNPLYLQLVIDQGFALRDADLILLLTLLFAVLLVAKTVVSYFRSVVLLQFSNQLGFQLAENTFHHLIRLPLKFFEKREMGDIVSRFSSLESIKQLITQEMITVVVDGIFSVLTLVLLYLYSPLLCGVSLIGITSFCLLRGVSINREKTLREESLVAGAKQQTSFMENVRSVSTTKLNGIEREREHDWLSSYVTYLNSGYHLGSFQLSISTAQGLIFGLDHVVTIYLGATLVFDQVFSVGQLMSFIFLKQHFIGSITSMVPKLAEIKLMRLELDRLADITNHERDEVCAVNSLADLGLRATVEVKGLSFAYSDHGPTIINNINCQLDAGKILGVWGRSGCGKTTFLKLLVGNEEPSSGNILFGGRKLKEIPKEQRRGYIGAVLQEETLLLGSLAYNIHLDLERFDEEKLMRVCDLVGLAEVVRSLPMGFSTKVGELGLFFSAGQIQRLLLARALYQEPKILILDEALSHLSEQVGVELLNRIQSLGTSVILVSHSPALLKAADEQLLLDGELQI